MNTLESICAKGALGYYVQAGLEASIIHADIFSIKKSLIDINEEIKKISNCEKYDLQSAQDYLLLEEGEETNLKVVKKNL
ncbi:hypothetical protein ACT7C4_19140 [Bacillus pacificus]